MYLRNKANILAGLIILMACSFSQAQDYKKVSNLKQLKVPKNSILLAQAEADDSYDPFADYSEFDENSDEEADINFFKNGRFFTVGMVSGMRGFTDSLAKLYATAPTFGLQIAYFMDLRMAVQFSFLTSDHAITIPTTENEIISGNVSFTNMGFGFKYFFNTQNIVKGVANLNPYMLLGFSQVYRTYTLQTEDGFGREAVMGFDGGLGIEVPIMRKKGFLGFQATYHVVNYKDENKPIQLSDPYVTNSKPNGDQYDILAIIGLNF